MILVFSTCYQQLVALLQFFCIMKPSQLWFVTIISKALNQLHYQSSCGRRVNYHVTVWLRSMPAVIQPRLQRALWPYDWLCSVTDSASQSCDEHLSRQRRHHDKVLTRQFTSGHSKAESAFIDHIGDITYKVQGRWPLIPLANISGGRGQFPATPIGVERLETSLFRTVQLSLIDFILMSFMQFT